MKVEDKIGQLLGEAMGTVKQTAYFKSPELKKNYDVAKYKKLEQLLKPIAMKFQVPIKITANLGDGRSLVDLGDIKSPPVALVKAVIRAIEKSDLPLYDKGQYNPRPRGYWIKIADVVRK